MYGLAAGQSTRDLLPAAPWTRPILKQAQDSLLFPHQEQKLSHSCGNGTTTPLPAPVLRARAALSMGGPGAQQAAAHLRGTTRQKSTTISWCESKECFTLPLQGLGGRLCNPLRARSQPSLQSGRVQTAQNNNLALSRGAENYCCFDSWHDWTAVWPVASSRSLRGVM